MTETEKKLAEEIAEATAKGAYTSKELAQHLISKGYRKAVDTISQDSIKAMKKAEAIQFGRIIPIDHDRKG